MNNKKIKNDMKIKLFGFLLVWAAVIPAAVSGLIMCVWNMLMPQLFGLGAIGFWQSAALFLLCQLLSGGFVLGLLLLVGGIHVIVFHRNHAAHERWKKMTDEQRREVFLRRMERFGHVWHNEETDKQAGGDGNRG